MMFRGFEGSLVICLLALISSLLIHAAADNGNQTGTRWAILVAGSSGYKNYRHQADVCHAYQILRRGGLEEKNIVVFMYDDIASNVHNPHPGVIINSPLSQDVYAGVPKDYTSSHATVANFLAVLLGDKSKVHGGSGKIVDSGPNDHVFIYYSDHGGPGVLGMPTKPNLYANDLIDALKKKHAARGFKEMVIYVEACESGSIFEGLLPRNLNIYATTASNAEESSWGAYCPGTDPSPPPEYLTCLGDLYSVAWMEDSEAHNLEEETFKDQYRYVKGRTSDNYTYSFGSHVKQYGAYNISGEQIYLYMGSDPTNKNVSNELIAHLQYFHEENKVVGMHQRDADLLFLWNKFKVETEGSNEKLEAQENLLEAFSHRIHLDNSVGLIGKLLFGYEQGPMTLSAVRPPRIPLVDNWACLKSMVRTFESYCGSLTEYGMKHMRAFANICNAGIKTSTFAEASLDICAGRKIPPTLNPIEIGFSA